MRINANQGRRLSVRQSSGQVLIAIVLELEEATPHSDLPKGTYLTAPATLQTFGFW
jgi:hypothetical protein